MRELANLLLKPLEKALLPKQLEIIRGRRWVGQPKQLGRINTKRVQILVGRDTNQNTILEEFRAKFGRSIPL